MNCCTLGTGNAYLVKDSVDGSFEVLVLVVRVRLDIDAEMFLPTDNSFTQSYLTQGLELQSKAEDILTTADCQVACS